MKKFSGKIFTIVFIGIFICSSIFSINGIISRANNLKQSENEVEELREIIEESTTTTKEIPTTNTVDATNMDNISPKYSLSKNQNSDFVFWITIPSTKIDYPVLQANDNSKYLETSFEGNQSLAGSIFLDYRCNLETSPNLVVYGHNMKNGTMFHNLRYYEKESFLKENKFITIELQNEKHIYEIFSTYVTSTNFNYIKTDFINKEEYDSFLKEIKGKSEIDINMDLNTNDKILTLSTCSYEFDNARRAVHAKLVDVIKN